MCVCRCVCVCVVCVCVCMCVFACARVHKGLIFLVTMRCVL